MTAAAEQDAGPPGPRDKLHGRKHGRRLRAGRQVTLDALLPELEIALPEAGQGTLDPAGLFRPPRGALWLEIGFGAGEHLAAQARAHPEAGFIGCEVYINGVARLVGEIARDRLSNIRLFTGDAQRLIEALPEASVDRAFVLFPDPWPKRRHWKRRFVGPHNLATLARILKDGAELRLATDHADYLIWMLQHLGQADDFEWLARHPADWHSRPDDWPE
ncbi:MAG TPA: tRNA (guanosine(46)-N7)-methyltransferase TrmB, partial [Alphaproteobacteria bacterium]|nr:tRNA (guanosine(46)-N7)-methyltransferase TrmB [Alphaproteobacteria bacterium]